MAIKQIVTFCIRPKDDAKIKIGKATGVNKNKMLSRIYKFKNLNLRYNFFYL